MSDLLLHDSDMERQPQSQDSELSGYVELGMDREAHSLARHYLRKSKPNVSEFVEAIQTVLVANSPKRWKRAIEAAYDRLLTSDRKAVRSSMLYFYHSIAEYRKAAEFIPKRHQISSGPELLCSVDTLLELDRVKQAGALAKNGQDYITGGTSQFEKDIIVEALARYYARIGRWDHAAYFWIDEVSHESPLLRNALTGVVQIFVAHALTAVRKGLKTLAARKREPDLSLEIQLPGIEKSLTGEIERDLLSLQKKLERILPPKHQKELGMKLNTFSPTR